MCFTKGITVGLMLMSAGTGLYLKRKPTPATNWQIFFYFAAMELLQLIQHFTINDCSNPVNQLATVLAYLHVCFQPVVVNRYVFRSEPNRDVEKTCVRLSWVAGVLMSLRLSYLALDYLPAAVFKLLPGLPNLSLAGSSAVCSWESMCGTQTCTRMGKLHLQWHLPLTPPSYYIPSAFVHFMLFFVPALTAPGVWHVQRIWTAVVGIVTGPVTSQLLSYIWTGGSDEWRLEWATTWCLYSTVLCIGFAVSEVIMANNPTLKAKWEAECAACHMNAVKRAHKPVIEVFAYGGAEAQATARKGRTV